MTKMSKITRICEMLEEHYGRPEWPGRGNILDELILTILSQNTSDSNTKTAFARLRESFSTWDDVRLARIEHIADAIRIGGLANLRASRIKQIQEQIFSRQGNLDLEWIGNTPDARAVEYLMAFEGVGRKTAACTLMFALGRPVFPVDTHVHRVSERLGLIPKVSADKAHDLLQELIAPNDVYSIHINLVTHGRKICHAQRPERSICVVRSECDFNCENTKERKRENILRKIAN